MDPFVLTEFVKTTPLGDEDPLVSVVVFEWSDEDYVGVWPTQGAAAVGDKLPVSTERVHLHGRECHGIFL